MELRTILFSLLAGLVTFLVVAGAISALALSGHVTHAPDTLAFTLMDFVPAIALGVTAGLLSKAEPALNALVASVISSVFFAALVFATVHHFTLESRLSVSELLSDYAAPLLVATLAAHFTFSARPRSNRSYRADPPPPRGRGRH